MIGILCLLNVTALASPSGEQNSDIKDRMISHLNLSDVTLFVALNELSRYEHIPIGIELGSYHRASTDIKVKLEIKNSRLSDILDELVRQAPDYRWDLNDGVINFTPIQERDPFILKALNTRIVSFGPRRGMSRLQLRNAITELPELDKLLKSNNISALNFGTSPDTIHFRLEVDLSIANTDLRGVLNNIVRKNDDKFWVIGWDGDTKDGIYINF